MPAVKHLRSRILNLWLAAILLVWAARAMATDIIDFELPRLSFGWTVPPAAVVVLDSQGRRNGVDVTKPIDTVGQGAELHEIPNSQVGPQQNISSADPETFGRQHPETRWSTEIASAAPQTFTVSITGMKDGIEVLSYSGVNPEFIGTSTPFDVIPLQHLNVLVAPGTTRLLTFQYDPVRSTLSITRVVTGPDFLRTLEIACSTRLVTAEAVVGCEALKAKTASGEVDALLKTLSSTEAEQFKKDLAWREGQCSSRLITSEGVCQSLRAKAAAAAKALKRGRTKAARGAVNAFLNELNAQGVEHVKEPALTILREEAEALLLPPPTMPKPKSRSKGPTAK